MATTTTITKMLFRRGNNEDRKQTILASGEPGWTLDTNRLYIGDGVTPGGVPALSARSDHLHYMDTVPGGQRWTEDGSNNIAGSPQFLDINVPGLSHSLAGVEVESHVTSKAWFHPVVGSIRSDYDIILTGNHNNDLGEPAGDTNITHTGAGRFTINKTSSVGDLVLGHAENPSAMIIRGAGTYEQGDYIPEGKQLGDAKDGGDIEFHGEITFYDRQDQPTQPNFFANRTVIFKDKNLEVNVDYDPANNTIGTNGVPSDRAGLMISHKDQSKAGFIGIHPDPGKPGYTTMQLQPTVYYNNWESMEDRKTHTFDETAQAEWYENGGTVDMKYPLNVTNRSTGQNSTFTSNFTPYSTNRDTQDLGGTIHEGTDEVSPKPINFTSVRPNGAITDKFGRKYWGEANMVLEAGLIVYDSGDDRSELYNAYLINQSVDVQATPTFSGLKIRSPYSDADGTPIDVQSGGTGKTEFNPGSIIYTSGNYDPDSPGAVHKNALQSLTLSQGDFAVGTTNGGVTQVKLSSTDKWLTWTTTTDGVVSITNKFAPLELEDQDEIRTKWFAKWHYLESDIKTDGGQVLTPTGDRAATADVKKDPSDTLKIAGDQDAIGATGFNQTTGGVLMTRGITRGSTKQLEVMHNNLARPLYNLGYHRSQTNNGAADIALNASTVTYTDYANSPHELEVSKVYAGTVKNGDDYVGSTFMPVENGDTIGDCVEDFQHTGYTFGALMIDRTGHVVGVRSKDFDNRYAQKFNLGVYGANETNQYSPSDHLDNLSNVTTSLSSTAGGNVFSSFESEYLVGTHKVAGGGTVQIDMKSSGYDDTEVISELQFADYGTVNSFNTVNLQNIFYDKPQVATIAMKLQQNINQLTSSNNSLDDSAFKRDSNTVTRGTVTTTWGDSSSVRFSSGNPNNPTATIRTYEQTVTDANADTGEPELEQKEIFLIAGPSDGETRIGGEVIDIGAADNRLLYIDKDGFQVRNRFAPQIVYKLSDNTLSFVDGGMTADETKLTLSTAGIVINDDSDDIMLDGAATRSKKSYTYTNNTNNEHYLTFVDTNQTTTGASNAQTLRVNKNITFNPGHDQSAETGKLTVTGDLEVSGKIFGEFDIGATRLRTKEIAHGGDFKDYQLTFVQTEDTNLTGQDVRTNVDLFYSPRSDGKSKLTLAGDNSELIAKGNLSVAGQIVFGDNKIAYDSDKLFGYNTAAGTWEVERRDGATKLYDTVVTHHNLETYDAHLLNVEEAQSSDNWLNLMVIAAHGADQTPKASALNNTKTGRPIGNTTTTEDMPDLAYHAGKRQLQIGGTLRAHDMVITVGQMDGDDEIDTAGLSNSTGAQLRFDCVPATPHDVTAGGDVIADWTSPAEYKKLDWAQLPNSSRVYQVHSSTSDPTIQGTNERPGKYTPRTPEDREQIKQEQGQSGDDVFDSNLNGDGGNPRWQDVTPFVFDVKLDTTNSYVDWQDLNETQGSGYVMRIGRGNGKYMAYSSEGGELSVPKQITLGDGRLVWEDGQLKFGKRRYNSNGNRNSVTELAEIVTKDNISEINAPYIKSVAKSDDDEYRVPFHKQENSNDPGWSIYHDSVENDFTYNPQYNRLSVRNLSADGDVSADTFTGGDFSGNGDAIKFTYDGTEYNNLPLLLEQRLVDYSDATDNPYIRTTGQTGKQTIAGEDLILEDTTTVGMYAGRKITQSGLDSSATHQYHGQGGFIGYDSSLGGHAGVVGPGSSSFMFRTTKQNDSTVHNATYKWGALMKYTEWSGTDAENNLVISVRSESASDNTAPGSGDDLTTLNLQSGGKNSTIGRYISSNQKFIVTGAEETVKSVDEAIGSSSGWDGDIPGVVIHKTTLNSVPCGVVRLIGSGSRKGAIHFADQTSGMKMANSNSGEIYWSDTTGLNVQTWSGPSSTTLLQVKSDGELLVGTGANARFRVDTTGKGYFKNDVVAYYSFSDERLKENITTLDSSACLDTVCGLQAVEYEWKDSSSKYSGPQIGLIAQQVEAVEPRVVKHEQRGLEDETIYKQVEYDKLVPMLIESIKVLKERVEYLESQIK